LEKACVEISGEQVTGSPKNAITELWGEQVAQALYDRWGVVSKENFLFVYWEGMEHVMKLFLKMFHVWVTKHVSHFQGTNRDSLGCCVGGIPILAQSLIIRRGLFHTGFNLLYFSRRRMWVLIVLVGGIMIEMGGLAGR
jgi:hypothetical protein